MSFSCTAAFNSFCPVHSSLENNSYLVSTTSRLPSHGPFSQCLLLFAYLNSACTVLRTSLRHSYASIIATAAAEIVRPLRLLSVAIWLTWTRSDRIRPSYVASRCIKRLCGSGSTSAYPAHSGFVDSVEVSSYPTSPRGDTPC